MQVQTGHPLPSSETQSCRQLDRKGGHPLALAYVPLVKELPVRDVVFPVDGPLP